MTEPFLGQITMTAFPFAPKGHARCDGALLPINQNQALFSLLGTAYGGDGQTTFALPDLRGRVPIHAGNGHAQGESGGQSAVTISEAALPTHTHGVRAAASDGTSPSPAGSVLAGSPAHLYHTLQSPTAMAPGSAAAAGGGAPHPNLQPYTVIGFCIALQGIYPSHT